MKTTVMRDRKRNHSCDDEKVKENSSVDVSLSLFSITRLRQL